LNPSEYDVTYSVKEWLIHHSWRVVAFDPPGAQGTFSIPNPSKKEKGYKGQTGTQSPDIIAIKNNIILIIECKDYGDLKIKQDIIKLNEFLQNESRMNVFEKIIVHACKANEILLTFDNSKIIFAKAHGGSNLLLQKNIETFHVKIIKNWDKTMINPTIDLSEIISVKYYPTSEAKKKLLED
jgi:Holliday junction resolvase